MSRQWHKEKLLPPVPDAAAMRQFLGAIFGESTGGLVEVSWTDVQGKPVHARLFPVDELDEIVTFAEERNRVSYCSAYVGAATRDEASPAHQRCNGAHFLEAPALWVDIDDPAAVDARKERWQHCMPSVVVATGRRTCGHRRGGAWTRRSAIPRPSRRRWQPWRSISAVTRLLQIRRASCGSAAASTGRQSSAASPK